MGYVQIAIPCQGLLKLGDGFLVSPLTAIGQSQAEIPVGFFRRYSANLVKDFFGLVITLGGQVDLPQGIVVYAIGV